MKILIAGTTTICALAAAGAALASQPTIERFTVDRTRVISASASTCPFDVVRHSEGVYTTKTFR